MNYASYREPLEAFELTAAAHAPPGEMNLNESLGPFFPPTRRSICTDYRLCASTPQTEMNK